MLLKSQSVARIGLVKGVGPASPSEPRYNFTGDPYFTDGYRAVIIMTDSPTSIHDVDWLDWEPFESDLGRKLQRKTRTSSE